MMTFRYHFGTIIAIFLSLGLGIVIGGTLGQPWISSTQHEMFQILAKKYDETTNQNNEMQKQMTELSKDLELATNQFATLLTRTMDPVLQGKNIVWIHDGSVDDSLLTMVIQSAGGKLEEYTQPLLDWNEWNRLSQQADIVLVSDEEIAFQWSEWKSKVDSEIAPVVLLQTKDSGKNDLVPPRFITTGLDLTQPDSLIKFVQILRSVMEKKEATLK
jgi:hypothetical protein